MEERRVDPSQVKGRGVDADRVGVVEGYLEDLSRGHVPNVFAERGWKAEWKHKRKGLVTRASRRVLPGKPPV
jgi:hypothetical protein